MTTPAPAWDPDRAAAALASLADAPLDASAKGFAGLPAPVSARALVTDGLAVGDPALSTPLLVLSASAIEANIATLAAYLAAQGVEHAPHAKTTMSPEIFVRQLAAGAWGLTAASVTQARVFAGFGARRVLIANEVADPASIASLARLLDAVPDLEAYCHVDSVAGVELLAAVDGPRPAVLVELGVPGGRAGVRDPGEAVAVARAAGRAGLAVAGVSCFEGPVAEGPRAREAVTELFTSVRETGERLVELGLLAPPASAGALLLSAGGSHHFDLAAGVLGASAVADTTVVVRSGSYVVHDHGTYLRDSPALRGAPLEPFRPAIQVHATVLSRPEPTRAILDAGRRDVSFDSGLPVVLTARTRTRDEVPVAGAEVVALNDQHAFVDVPADSALAVGDVVALGISHPCTTFDKWRLGVIADDAGRVREIAHTFF